MLTDRELSKIEARWKNNCDCEACRLRRDDDIKALLTHIREQEVQVEQLRFDYAVIRKDLESSERGELLDDLESFRKSFNDHIKAANANQDRLEAQIARMQPVVDAAVKLQTDNEWFVALTALDGATDAYTARRAE